MGLELRSWIVNLVVVVEGATMSLRYGIMALDRENALVRAGMRLALKVRGAELISSSVNLEKETKKKTFDIPG